MADTLDSLEIEITHKASGAAEAISKVADAVNKLSRALEKALPNLIAFRNAMGQGMVNVNTGSIQQTANTINNIGTASGKAKEATKQAAKGINDMSKSAKKAHNPLQNFVSSLKRIAFYRFLRSIIKNIAQAFQEGLEKAYTFSSGISDEGHRFAEAMDSMKSSSNQMKGQLGSAFISLLAAIQPIVEAIIGLVVKLADALSQLFAAFTGKTYLKANATAAKFADTMKSGAGSAKEWKNQLMGFDEINRLNEPSGGGGGGGANPLDGYSFEDTPISEFWLKLAAKVKEFYVKIKPIIDDIKLIFSGLIDFITGVFTGDWELAFSGLGKIVEGFGGLVQHTTEFVVSLFDELAENGIQSISNLFDFLGEKTGIDLTKQQKQVVFTLNFIRYLVEDISLYISETIGHLCKAVSAALEGDWKTAWEEAAEVSRFQGYDIVKDAWNRAMETTEVMTEVSSEVSKHSESSATSVASASRDIGNSMATAGNGSATMAETVAANMNAVGAAMLQASGNSITLQDTGNSLSFVANVRNIAVGIARAFTAGGIKP